MCINYYNAYSESTLPLHSQRDANNGTDINHGQYRATFVYIVLLTDRPLCEALLLAKIDVSGVMLRNI